MELPLRKCVVAVVSDGQGRYLVGERAGKSGAWQFPQGGVDEGESLVQCLRRELTEEVGCGDIVIERQGDRDVAYLFPPDLDVPIAKKYRGQTQKWFLVRFAAGAGPDLEKSDGEFQNLAWKDISTIVKNIVGFKQEAYREGLESLGLKAED